MEEGSTLYWSTDSDIGLKVEEINFTPTAILIDSNKIEQDQYYLNGTDLMIKISALLSVDANTMHKITIQGNESEITYELYIASHDTETETEGDYIIDRTSLIPTIRYYESIYSNSSISLNLFVEYYDNQISETDTTLIKEKSGCSNMNAANVKMRLYVDGEYKEDVSELISPAKVTVKFCISQLTNEKLYRVYQNVCEELTSTSNESDEKVTFDKENNKIIVEASKFSTYAITYGYASPATGLASNHPVTFVIIGIMMVTMVTGIVLMIVNYPPLKCYAF